MVVKFWSLLAAAGVCASGLISVLFAGGDPARENDLRVDARQPCVRLQEIGAGVTLRGLLCRVERSR